MEGAWHEKLRGLSTHLQGHAAGQQESEQLLGKQAQPARLLQALDRLGGRVAGLLSGHQHRLQHPDNAHTVQDGQVVQLPVHAEQQQTCHTTTIGEGGGGTGSVEGMDSSHRQSQGQWRAHTYQQQRWWPARGPRTPQSPTR
jgi:hypothetical protein